MELSDLLINPSNLQTGRIWTTKSRPSATDGLLFTLGLQQQRRGGNAFVQVAFNCRCDTVAALNEHGQVISFDLEHNRYAVLKRGGSAGVALAFSSTLSHELFVALEDGLVEALDAAKRAAVGLETSRDAESQAQYQAPGAVLRGHRGPAHTLACHPSAPLLLACSADLVSLWESRALRRVGTLAAGSPPGAAPTEPFVSAALSPSGGHVLTCLPHAVVVWRSADLGETATYKLPPSHASVPLCSVTVDGSGSHAVGAGAGGLLALWSLRSHLLLKLLEVPGGSAISQAAWLPAPRQERLALVCADGALRFVVPSADEVVGTLRPRGGRGGGCGFRSVAADPLGRAIAAVCSDGRIALYSLEGGSGGAGGGGVGGGGVGSALRREPEWAQREWAQRDGSRRDGSRRDGSRRDGSRRDGERRDGERRAPEWRAPERRQRGQREPVPRRAAPQRSRRLAEDRAGGLAGGRRDRGGAAEAEADFHRTPLLQGRSNLAQLLPLSRLGLLPEESALLDARKLRSILQRSGRFPDEHRRLVWRFLLQLPGNASAHKGLSARGQHPANAPLHDRLSLRSRRCGPLPPQPCRPDPPHHPGRAPTMRATSPSASPSAGAAGSSGFSLASRTGARSSRAGPGSRGACCRGLSPTTGTSSPPSRPPPPCSPTGGSASTSATPTRPSSCSPPSRPSSPTTLRQWRCGHARRGGRGRVQPALEPPAPSRRCISSRSVRTPPRGRGRCSSPSSRAPSRPPTGGLPARARRRPGCEAREATGGGFEQLGGVGPPARPRARVPAPRPRRVRQAARARPPRRRLRAAGLRDAARRLCAARRALDEGI